MTGSSRPAGSSTRRTDCTIRPVTTITSQPGVARAARAPRASAAAARRRPRSACGRGRSRRRRRRAGSSGRESVSRSGCRRSPSRRRRRRRRSASRSAAPLNGGIAPGAVRRPASDRPSRAAGFGAGRGSGRPCRSTFASGERVAAAAAGAQRRPPCRRPGRRSCTAAGTVADRVGVGTVPTTLVGAGVTVFSPGLRGRAAGGEDEDERERERGGARARVYTAGRTLTGR